MPPHTLPPGGPESSFPAPSRQPPSSGEHSRAAWERDQLFLLSHDLLCIAGLDGFFRQLNPAWERELGWSLHELMAAPFFSFAHPADLEAVGAAVHRLQQGDVTADIEGRFRTKDGSYRWLSWTATSLPDEGLIFAVVRDVEARKRLERMKDDFISVVSHELRTPLTSIRGSLALLLGGVAGELGEKVRTLTEVASRNSERLVLLVNDILDIEKIELGTMHFRPVRTDLVALVRQSVESNRAYAQQYDAEIRIAAAEPAFVWVDPDRLQQVLANLLSNAAKHSPRGGVIDVHVRRDVGRALVSITDHGPGIPKDFQPRIFEKFAQAETTSTHHLGGTGLGLSISKAILERHGGRIWFESNPGTGTTFSFELAALAEEAPASP